MTGSVPVNLNYTASQEALESAITRCNLNTIITSQKLLDRFSIPVRPGMVMLEVDYTSARHAMNPDQNYSPFEIGLAR